jgi:ABC-type Na+ efflux pump permease subunit
MTFLPIVARELRTAARRPATYWVRGGAALALIIIGTWYFLVYSGLPPQDIARGLFALLTGSAVLYCLLSGVWFTADCLSEEKRDGTLGLLFLTDLKGYDVVFGKLAATSLNGLYAALAVVPILALPLLLGGVTPGEFGRMALVAVNTLFFSLTLGICISSLSRSPRKAMSTTLLLLLFLTALLPAFGEWRRAIASRAQVGLAWLLPSTGFSYYSALAGPYKVRPDLFWWSLGVIHGLGWTWLVLASVVAPRAWQDRPATARGLRWRERWQAWRFGNAADRADFRRLLLDRNACFWLSARERLRPAYLWTTLGLLACGWVWGLAKWHRDWLNDGIYVLTALLLNLLLKVWFGLEAGRQLAEDRRQGSLELLLSTPLTVEDILHGQLLALRRQFLGPVTAVLVIGGLLMIAGAYDAGSLQGPADQRLWGLAWGAGMIMLVADLAALYWVGMWQGLTAKNPTRAAAGSLVRILVLPWIALALWVLLLALVWPSAEGEAVSKVILGAWFAVGLAVDIGFGASARQHLLSEFREAATRRYERAPGFWKRLAGFRAR